MEAFLADVVRATAPVLPMTGGDADGSNAVPAADSAAEPGGVGGSGWLAGAAGRRVAVLLRRLVTIHLPGVAGSCQDCRWQNPSGRGCPTWVEITETLVGLEPAAVERAYSRLLVGYGTLRPPAHTPAGPAEPERAEPERAEPPGEPVWTGWADEQPAHRVPGVGT